MQVPVSPDDFKKNSGFKRLAKYLQRNWPGTNAIQLSKAQELMAKGLGYQSHHDILRSSEASHLQCPPSLSEIRSNIFAIVTSELEDDILPRQVVSFISEMPLRALKALHSEASTHSGCQAVLRKAMLTNHLPERGDVNGTPLSREVIERLKSYVVGRKDVRDMALLELLLSGVRAIEIVDLKGKCIHVTRAGFHIKNEKLTYAMTPRHFLPNLISHHKSRGQSGERYSLQPKPRASTSRA